MTTLSLDRIEITDFKSFKGKHVFDLRSYGPGLHYVRGVNAKHKRLGPNGTGKSTLFIDAPTWCMYGETTDGLKNPDVKPWHFTGTTKVRLFIRRGKTQHIIKRTARPNLLTIDGKEASTGDVEALVMPLRLWKHTVVQPQGEHLFFDLKPADRMALFVEALILDRWDDRAKVASNVVSELTEAIAGYEGELEALSRQCKDIEDDLERANADKEAWAKAWRRDASKRERELKDALRSLETIEDARGRADLAYEGAEVELRQLQRDLTKASQAETEAHKEWNDVYTDICQANGQFKKLDREIKELGEGDECSHCGQSLEGTALEKHRDVLMTQRKRLKRILNAWPDADLDAKVEAAVNATEGVRKHIAKFQTKANAARDDLDTLNKRHAEATATVKALKDAAAKSEAEQNPHYQGVKRLKKRLADCQADIDDVNADLDKDEAIKAHTSYWIKGFKDIRLFVLEEVISELEFATNAMLEDAGLVGWRVTYPLERETARGTVSRGLTIMVQSPDSEGAVKWESWSGGEAQRLRVVGALALSETLLNHAGVTPSLEVLDEPTQHLSREGVKDLCQYLSDRAKRLDRSVFYVDHASVESTAFASVTTIKRDGDGSRIIEG